MSSSEESLLVTWLKSLDKRAASAGRDTSVALPGILHSCTFEVLLGKIYSSSEPSSSSNALHSWTATVQDPNDMEATYTAEILRQAGGPKMKYSLRFSASKGSILMLQDVKAWVNKARKKGADEHLVMTPQPDNPNSFDFSTNVHCRRELDLHISFIMLLKVEPAAVSELDYMPPSTHTLFTKRQETGDLTLTAVDENKCRSSRPVHSAVLKLCCAYFETALGESWKKGTDVELPVFSSEETLELLVNFIYMGRKHFTELLSDSDNFETAEQLYLLGDAMGIDSLRKLAGARIEQRDFVKRALASKLKDHQHFAADHLERVAETGRDMAMQHSARAQVDLIGLILQACPDEPRSKRSASEMMDVDDHELDEASKRARVDEPSPATA